MEEKEKECKIMTAVMNMLQSGTGESPNLGWLVSATNINQKKLKRATIELERKGLVEVHNRDSNHPTYKLTSEGQAYWESHCQGPLNLQDLAR